MVSPTSEVLRTVINFSFESEGERERVRDQKRESSYIFRAFLGPLRTKAVVNAHVCVCVCVHARTQYAAEF